MSWATTASGRTVDYLATQPEQIEVFDIITSLSRNHRFGGFSPLKIGQHDVEVAILMMDAVAEAGGPLEDRAEAGLVGIIHDLPEYIVGDCPTPFKRILSPQFDHVEGNILEALLEKWQAKDIYHGKWNELLHQCDKKAVHSEAIRYKLDGWIMDFDTFTLVPAPRRWVPEDAEQMFAQTVWTEDETRMYLTFAINKLLLLTGRKELLGNHNDFISNTTDPAKHLLTPQLPAQLLSGKRYL